MEERRLWWTVYVLLVIAALLLIASFSIPWFTVAVERNDASFEASFYLDEYRWGVFLRNDPDPAFPRDDYRPDMEVKTVMDVTFWLVLLGLLALLGFVACLVAYHMGVLATPKALYALWVVLVLFVGLGLLFFTLTIANATENDIRDMASGRGIPIDPNVNVRFWDGTGEPVGFGDLVSSPGASWFLALLGLANVLGATVVLFRFPAPEEAADSPAVA